MPIVALLEALNFNVYGFEITQKWEKLSLMPGGNKKVTHT